MIWSCLYPHKHNSIILPPYYVNDVGKASLHFDYHLGMFGGHKPLRTDVRQIFNVPSVHYTSHITVLLPFYTRPKRGTWDTTSVRFGASLPTINIELSPKQTERGVGTCWWYYYCCCDDVRMCKMEWCRFNMNICARIALNAANTIMIFQYGRRAHLSCRF